MKKVALCILILITASIQAQTGIQTVEVKANGTDIRDVLYQLFTQAKKSYVLQPGIHEALNLNLVNVEFDEALQIVCEAASLRAEQQNGIYYIGRKKAGSTVPKLKSPPKVLEESVDGVLDKTVLEKRVTTKLAKAPLKKVLAEFTRQTHVRFELDPHVPNYRLDAFLTKLTLRQALDRIAKAANLGYEFTDHKTIRIHGSEDLLDKKI